MHHKRASRDIAIKEREINNIKIKIIPFIIYFCRNYIIMNDKFKSKKAASVSESLALFS